MSLRISRRELLGAAVAARLPLRAALRTEDLRVLTDTGSGEMMQEYLLRLAGEITARRQERLRALRSESDIRSWQESNRARFLELIGGLPRERTALHPRITGTLVRDGYEVRKIIFESLPEFYVTANLYVPSRGQPPYPAVLAPCGHSLNGKAYAEYQHLYIGLVRRGYVVLTWDAVSHGERFQLWDFVFRHRGLAEKSNEHGILGIREYLLGQNLARYLIWDGVRALDYLAGLPEVDATKIGVTGNSGGGALSTYLAMLDSRIAAASIVTFLSSIPKKIEARILDAEADPEQDIQGLFGAGIDHAELAGMIAPRPVLIGAALRDFFPIAGTRETFAELKVLYEKLGAAERVDMAAFDHEHMYSQPLREATCRWFDKWLKDVDNEVNELPATIEPDAELECTETGQVVSSLGGKRLIDFDRAELRALTRGRGDVANALRKKLGLLPVMEDTREKVSDIRAVGFRVEKLVLKPEAGITVPVRIVTGERTGGGVVVYLRDREGAHDTPEFFERLAKKGRTVVIADVRGFGETKSPRNVPDKRMYYYHPRDGMDADYAYAALSLGRPLAGMRVQDALAVVRMARSLVKGSPLTLVGRGWAGLIALFCAAVEPAVDRLAIEGFLASYAEMVESEQYAQPASLVIPGALRDFDVADVLAALAPRPVLAMNPQDAQTRKMPSQAARAALAGSRCELRTAPTEPEVGDALEEWI
ncbi:MAG TPA: acetylxylan esterase [Bryobacteraceae bacterium]|nr:acetylxylan esterase [Bryobacteraceae bacterium]